MRVFLLFVLLLSYVSAQTYEEYLREQEQAFSSFKEARDKEFSEFLNKEWKAYQEAQGMSGYKEDKPKDLPKARKTTVIKPKKKVLVVQQPEVAEKPKVYTKIIIPPVSKKLKTLYLTFFGVDLEVHYDRSVLLSLQAYLTKDAIAKGWDRLAVSEYETTVNELNEISSRLQLNDWARYLLVEKVARGIYKSENEAKLFSWFALLKMGYDAHIAFLILLLPIEGEMYDTVYYTLKRKRYYAVDYYAKGKLGSIMSYDNAYQGASSALDFSLANLPLFAQEKVSKRLVFRLEEKNTPVKLQYNANLLKFFQTYPQVGYTNYFFSEDSGLLRESIKSSFEPLIVGKSQGEALDILLNFVQNAFTYQVDKDQFNKEKVMFPSETLFYPYSDCEDRAILFSYMVRTLLGMDIVGVKYPNHMATAVKIDEKIKGEYITLDNKPYIVADPTYINASLGMSMPQFAGTNSYVIISTGAEK
jgi:transglutaminase superfamily protein